MGIAFHRLPTLLNTSIPMMPDGPVTTGASGSGARQPRGGPARSHLWYRFGNDFFSFVLVRDFFQNNPQKGLGKGNFLSTLKKGLGKIIFLPIILRLQAAAVCFLNWIEI